MGRHSRLRGREDAAPHDANVDLWIEGQISQYTARDRLRAHQAVGWPLYGVTNSPNVGRDGG